MATSSAGIRFQCFFRFNKFRALAVLMRVQHHLDAIIPLFCKHFVSIRRIVQRDPMGDDERRIDFAVLDQFQQWLQVPVHMQFDPF